MNEVQVDPRKADNVKYSVVVECKTILFCVKTLCISLDFTFCSVIELFLFQGGK